MEGNFVVHLPVMIGQVLDYLRVSEKGVYVDATLGLGGYSKEILSRLGAEGRLIGIDRDEDAISMARERLGNGRVTFMRASFSEISELFEPESVDGVVFDLGLSMLQLRQKGRGFSFLTDEPLDMRMDRSQPLTAEIVINTYPEGELRRILREYGEERRASSIAKEIVRKRPIKTTRELSELVERVYGRRGKIHPATKTFQAIRIEVNSELKELSLGLLSAEKVLKRGGRLVVLSYHSLEDRIVKNFMRDFQRMGRLRVLTKKPLTPSLDELRENPSARSAKMRAGEKI